MTRTGRGRLRRLTELVAKRYPGLDASHVVRDGLVLVDGRRATNPASLVPENASVRLDEPAGLRGEAKLTAALEAFRVDVGGRTALDAGAAAGGFPRVLLRAGARRVYAVDVGHGQLLGSLRQDARVVNLERTNIADLDVQTVPDPIGVITLDLSYVPLAVAVPELTRRIALAPNADLLALVKPQFELGLPCPPADEADLTVAVSRAAAAIASAGWRVDPAPRRSPVRGAGGAVEYLLHARRCSTGSE